MVCLKNLIICPDMILSCLSELCVVCMAHLGKPLFFFQQLAKSMCDVCGCPLARGENVIFLDLELKNQK